MPEQVVARVGALIGAPTCAAYLMTIGEDHVGWQYTEGGLKLEAGIAHASAAVEGCFEVRAPLQYRSDDNNAARHAGIFALFDWCWGGDQQWLVSQPNDRQYYSHDHGYYFPPEGQNWSIQDLETNVAAPREYPESFSGLRRSDVEAVADALDAVTRDALMNILSTIPKSWPVTDDELQCIGFFLERRASDTAARLRSHLGALS